ncbi:MAG: hypothetical protein EBX50_08740 [Chitinophagia bacterium]|nr:hypothetical protein [Chitinophagia bacterium]
MFQILTSALAKPYAGFIYRNIKKGMVTAVADQFRQLENLIQKAQKTQFGKNHSFHQISSHSDFIQAVPLRDYEQLKPYIEQIKAGQPNVLWKGKPLYFAKTSGTTSGIKYIPITKDSISNHINGARNAILCYIAETGKSAFANGKMIFLSGSPELERVGGIPTGRLSGIVNHHVPAYLRSNQLPSFQTNCIEDWETKLDKIVEETIHQPMSLISGIPPWMQMYFDRLQEKSGKKIGDLFPEFQLMIQGGVNFAPYQQKLFESIGRPVDIIELYPASEGFFAFQDSQHQPGLLLNTNSGIFYEFIPIADIGKEKPTRLPLEQVELGVQYAIVISSNAGLWGYIVGDTVKFVSLQPYRLIVTGRIKHFISAFGEHVIGEEVEKAMDIAIKNSGARITEFTVAPFISSTSGKSYHEWLIEFEQEPANFSQFIHTLDSAMRDLNVYYDDLISGNILDTLHISRIRKNGFIDYMKKEGKLGGQNKVPRLSNQRELADALQPFIIV